jgi:glycosyltransferase 2 family protein
VASLRRGNAAARYQRFFVTLRWSAILSVLGYRPAWTALIGSVFLGFLFNQLLPTIVGGDVFRALRAKQLGIPLETAIHSVLLDRASGFTVSLVFAAILLPFADFRSGRANLEWFIVGVAGLAALGLIALWALSRQIAFSRPTFASLHRRLVSLHQNIWAFAKSPIKSALVFVWATFNQLLPVAATSIFAVDLGIDVGLKDIALVVFIASIATTIPISIAGWGIREGLVVFLFGLEGVNPQSAFAISILFGAAQTLSSAPGALMLLYGDNLKRTEPFL